MRKSYAIGCDKADFVAVEGIIKLLFKFLPEIVFVLKESKIDDLVENNLDGYVVSTGEEGEFDWFALPFDKKYSLIFNYGNNAFMRLRNLFCYPVQFIGAGPGAIEFATYGAIDALRHCDVCLYDSLASLELLEECSGEKVFVGKRALRHSMKQEEINTLIVKYVRDGKRVVRLKGGDSGIFGRLAEEVKALGKLHLAYKVLPGISSMQVATTGSGLLLTRRGLSRGFSVMTCRSKGSHDFNYVGKVEQGNLPRVYFMGITQLASLVEELRIDGYDENMPVTVVFNVSHDDEEWIFGNIGNIAKICPTSSKPGLILVGEGMDRSFIYPKFGVLAGKKILLTCSEMLMEVAKREVSRYQGVALDYPLIKLVAEKLDYKELLAKKYDWLVVTSPSSVKILLNEMKQQQAQLRYLPKIMVCGKGTAEVFESCGIFPDAVVTSNYSSVGLIEHAKKIFDGSENVLRLRSDLAGEGLSLELEKLVNKVDDVINYRNELQDVGELEEFDGVCFASSSAVEAFTSSFGEDVLKGKLVSVIGQPTFEACGKLLPNIKVRKAEEATMKDCVRALAAASYLEG